MQNKILWIIALGALVLSGFGLAGGNMPTPGAITSTTKAIIRSAGFSTTGESAMGGLTYGDGASTLTDANGGTYTLTQAELLASNYLKFAAGGAGQEVIALQLPATSTLTTLIPNAGNCREWIYDAASLAAATTTTVTAGTGMDLVAYTTNDDVIDGAEFAQITMCRQPDTDVTVFTTEILHAD